MPSLTSRFLDIATPPDILTAPLFKFVVAVVSLTINLPFINVLPFTSKLSVGERLLIPTFPFITRNTVDTSPELLNCRSIELPG